MLGADMYQSINEIGLCCFKAGIVGINVIYIYSGCMQLWRTGTVHWNNINRIIIENGLIRKDSL